MKRKSRIYLVGFLCITLVLFSGIFVNAADYPERDITFIVTYSAGGGTDVGIRTLVNSAQKYFDVNIKIVNRPGGGGEVGAVAIKNSKPDGYTIGNLNTSHIMASEMRKTSFDPMNDYEFICLQVDDPKLIAVRADDERFNDLGDFIEYAKNNPGELSISTSGAGTQGHFSIEALNYYADVQTNIVHFGGAGESNAALMGGHVDANAQSAGEVKTAVENGEFKVIGVFTEERLAEFPDAHTFVEHGIDVTMSSGRGICAPKGTPEEIVNYLAEKFKKAMEDPDYLDKMEKIGLPAVYKGPADFKAHYEKVQKLYGELVDKVDLE